MTTIDSVNRFLTQQSAVGKNASLGSPINRADLRVLLNDPVAAAAALRQRVPLRLASALEVRQIETITTDFTDVLARLPVNWLNPLERYYLTTLVASLSILPIVIDFSTLPDGALPPQFNAPSWAIVGGKAVNTPAQDASGILNGNFEGAFSSGLAANWTEVGTPDTSEENSIVHGGTKSQKVVVVASNDGIQSSNVATGAIGDLYNGEMWVYSQGGEAITLNRGPANVNSRTSMSTLTATWEKLVVTWRRTNTGNIGIQARRFGASATFYVDDASLRKVNFANCFALTDGEIANVKVTTRSTPYKSAIAGTAVRWDSASNPANGIIVWHDGINQLIVEKVVAGVWTGVSTTGATYAANAPIRVECDGTSITSYYNGSLVKTDTISDAGIVGNTLHGMFSTYPDSTFVSIALEAL